MEEIPIISSDETIIEVWDKQWKKYLVPRINIIKAKQLKTTSETIEIVDKDGKIKAITTSVLEDLNEDNVTYHWWEVNDITNTKITVKKEHLLALKMTTEQTMIMDYSGKKKYIIPGWVCRKAKKYHSTEGKGNESIWFKLKDEEENIHFVTKPIIKFAKKKRMWNDETYSIEITDKDNNFFTIPWDYIRDIDEFNCYAEWCEVKDIHNKSVIVKKMDLQDWKERYDKNYCSDEVQEISNYTNVYSIRCNDEYLRLFPNKYSYWIATENGWVEVEDVTQCKCWIRWSWIEFYLNENWYDLAWSEEVCDRDNKVITINPFKIIQKIIMNYDDIISKSGPYINLITQSGANHWVKAGTVSKAKRTVSNTNEYVHIKDCNNVKIVTSIAKLNEIDENLESNWIVPLEDVNNKTVFVYKTEVKVLVNKIVNGEWGDECVKINDYGNSQIVVNVRQINMKNSLWKKNF